MKSFSRTSATIQYLRKFVSSVLNAASQAPDHSNRPTHFLASSYHHPKTVESFAEAVNIEIQAFEKWCSVRETDICTAVAGHGTGLVVSLLSLEKATRDTFASTFLTLLDIIRDLASKTAKAGSSAPRNAFEFTHGRSPPAVITALLLNSLLFAVQDHLSMADTVTSQTLIRVFAHTSEPVWQMVLRWLRNGTPAGDSAKRRESFGDASIDREFFIEDNELAILDPDYWSEGFVLRESDTENQSAGLTSVPVFLGNIANPLLQSGKATGLLRALGVPSKPLQELDPIFPSISAVLASHNSLVGITEDTMSTDTFSRIVYDNLFHHCQATGQLLTAVLTDECNVRHHLNVIEDLFLMRRGDIMTHFADSLFARVCYSSIGIDACRTRFE